MSFCFLIVVNDEFGIVEGHCFFNISAPYAMIYFGFKRIFPISF